MPVVKWIFTDVAESETYVFSINPSDGGIPEYKKNVVQQSTVAPGGKTLVFEGNDPPSTLQWTGTILSEAQYNAFVTWFQKRHQIQVTDHLGNTYTIYITGFTPTRQRAVHYPWKFTYVMDAIVIDV